MEILFLFRFSADYHFTDLRSLEKAGAADQLSVEGGGKVKYKRCFQSSTVNGAAGIQDLSDLR